MRTLSIIHIQVDKGGYVIETRAKGDGSTILNSAEPYPILKGVTGELIGRSFRSGISSMLYKKFLRLKTDKGLIKFVSKYGMVDPYGVVETHWKAQKDLKRLNDYVEKGMIKQFIGSIRGGSFFKGDIIPSEDGKRLFMQHRSLIDYMIFEMWEAFSFTSSRVKECDQCREEFAIGGKYGRRPDAKYCSDSCKTKACLNRKKGVY